MISVRSLPYNPESLSEDFLFERLMQHRIRKVLLVCSSYDAFMLEEDGRIDEQIFNEYTSLNLRGVPEFTHVDTAQDALNVLENEPIDLVIEMLSIRDSNSFDLAHEIKKLYPGIPIVVLTHFSREVSLRLKNEDLSAIDYVFSWLGDAELLVAIIKLVEDRLNLETDTPLGVQSILLIEDSVRYTSLYLPLLYKVIFTQSGELFKEGLNAHQRTMRMRGRPKVILANNFQAAHSMYNMYKNSLLGIISDVKYKQSLQSKIKEELGLNLCNTVRAEFPEMPILLQSSDERYKEVADSLCVGFIHKYSPGLQKEIQKYVLDNFAFGEFIFRNPDNLSEVERANDLDSLQKALNTIPDKVLLYHVTRNDISKWLNARGLFILGSIFKPKTKEDFNSAQAIRQYLINSISDYRARKGHGVIAQFNKDKYNNYIRFSRVGEGSIGGKARGLAFADAILKQYNMEDKWPGIKVQIPRTVVISTDCFDEFMNYNKLLEWVLYENPNDETILERFMESELPQSLTDDLKTFISGISGPVAVRSSSMLEDSYLQPFAGIYATFMVPFIKTPAEMTTSICKVIKNIYASVYFSESRAYMRTTSNSPEDEKMAIILQQVCGSLYKKHFYPACSGVARSINHYPAGREKASDGIAFIGFGLGKYIVEGGKGIRFSPRYPKHLLQLSNPQTALRETQKYYYALDITKPFTPSVNDDNLIRLSVADAEEDGSLKWVASTYNFETQTLRDGTFSSGKRVITFSNVLIHNSFPLADITRELLVIGKREMGNEVEIEFAVQLNKTQGNHQIFHLLQIRPIPQEDNSVKINLDNISQSKILAMSGSALGNGKISGICDCIYIKPDTFSISDSYKMAEQISAINALMLKENRNYILIGPGRWGSSDPSLGIPVKWSQISETRLIIETAIPGRDINPSQGSHFFQNLASFKIGYFTISDGAEDFIDNEFLNNAQILSSKGNLTHIRFDNPVSILINGKSSKGIILKPENRE